MNSDHKKTKSQLIAELEELRLSSAVSSTSLIKDGQFKQMVDGISQIIYEVDLEGNIIYANPSALDTFGYSAEDIKQGLHFTKVIHADDVGRVLTHMDHAIHGQGPVGIEYLAMHSDGSTFPIMVFSQGVYDSGVPIGIRGTVIDLSKIRRTEEALKKSEVYYRTLFETTGTSLVIIGEDSIIQKCNSQFEILSGFLSGDVEGKMKWSDFVDPVDLDRMQSYNAARLRGDGDAPREYGFVFLARGGINKHVHMVIAIIPGTKDRLCSLFDITDYMQAKEALQRSEERYSLVIRGTNDGYWDWDLTSGAVYFSPRYKEILGYTDEDFPNDVDSWRSKVYPDDLEPARAALQTIIRGEVDHAEHTYRMLHKDGSLRWVHAKGTGV